MYLILSGQLTKIILEITHRLDFIYKGTPKSNITLYNDHLYRVKNNDYYNRK